MKKRILSIVLCLSLFVATFATTLVVSAADDIREDGYCAEIKDYREEGNFTAPTREGKVFAGWYVDSAFETAIDPSVTEGEAWAKFVDPTVFTIQNQFNTGAHKKSATVDLRIITTIDSEWYAGIEFYLTKDGVAAKEPLKVDTVYTSLVNYDSTKEQFCNDSEYFAVEKITGIPAEVYTSELSITPKFTTYDGTVVTGTTRGTAEEPLTLAAKLPLANTVLGVRGDSDATWVVFTWNENVDLISNGTMWGYDLDGWSWGENSGVYYNGVKTWSKLYKNGVFYILLKNDMQLTVFDGDQIGIQGTCYYNGEAVVNFEPLTVEYNGETGKWEEVSRSTIVESTEATLSWNSSRKDAGTLFFNSNLAVEHPSVQTGWNCVYLDGKEVSLNLVRYGAKTYYFELGGVTINEGTKLVMQGTYTVGSSSLTVKPVTFQCVSKTDAGWTWEVVSRTAIVRPFTFSYEVVNGWWDNIRIKASSANLVPVNGLMHGSNFVGDGGIYIDNEKVENITIAKHSATGYYIYLAASGIVPADKMTVEVKGLYRHEYDGVVEEFEVTPIKFQFDANDKTLSERGSWVVVTE